MQLNSTKLICFKYIHLIMLIVLIYYFLNLLRGNNFKNWNKYFTLFSRLWHTRNSIVNKSHQMCARCNSLCNIAIKGHSPSKALNIQERCFSHFTATLPRTFFFFIFKTNRKIWKIHNTDRNGPPIIVQCISYNIRFYFCIVHITK